MRRVDLRPLVDFWSWTSQDGFWRVVPPGSRLHLEIGFGRGDFLVRQAVQHRDAWFAGVETAWPSIQRALRRIQQHRLQNLKIFPADAYWALKHLFPAGCLTTVWILFPDPWPKGRHAHRRLLHRAFFYQLNRVLAPGGTAVLATDAADYVRWALEQQPERGFSCQTEVYRGWPRYHTKYEQRWLAQGRSVWQVAWTKTEPLPTPDPEWRPMQTYRLKGCSSDRLAQLPEPYRENGLTVVYKECIHDPDRGVVLWKALIHEDGWVQKLFLEWRYRNRDGYLGPSDGSKFFPTYGLQKALDHLYHYLHTGTP